MDARPMAALATPALNDPPLLCPRCSSEMQARPRSGVVVDVCCGCGGVFLDRGELEILCARAAERPRLQGVRPRTRVV